MNKIIIAISAAFAFALFLIFQAVSGISAIEAGSPSAISESRSALDVRTCYALNGDDASSEAFSQCMADASSR